MVHLYAVASNLNQINLFKSTLKDSTISTFEENSDRPWVRKIYTAVIFDRDTFCILTLEQMLIGFKKNLASWGTSDVHLKFKINNGHTDH